MNKRVMLRRFGTCMLVLGVAMTTGAASAVAETNHLFDPQLSLTGGVSSAPCPTSPDDEVPDPSCPYLPPPEGPSGAFTRTTGIATDFYGNVYVAVEGQEGADEGRVDIFDSEGFFITELRIPAANGEPRSVAVDSKGYLYVYVNAGSGPELLRYKPSTYNPSDGEIVYGTAPSVVQEELVRNIFADYAALAVDARNDHLFINFGASHGEGNGAVQEFGSGEEGNSQLDPVVAETCCFDGPGLAIDPIRNRLYVPYEDQTKGFGEPNQFVIKVFELDGTHEFIETINGSSTPIGGWGSYFLSLAVDESTGHIFVYQQRGNVAIYELDETGNYLSTIERNFTTKEAKQQVIVDNGTHSPNGGESTNGRYVWATTAPGGAIGHAYAFAPSSVEAPQVQTLSFDEVTESEAMLEATISSGQAATSYRFEYVSKAQFDLTGFEDAETAGQGSVPASKSTITVSAQVRELAPGTSYVFRLVATNEVGDGERSTQLKTYVTFPQAPCPNEAFRIGPSAALPDCRAYELVTPADTAGRSPMGIGLASVSFPSLPASPDGNKVPFRIQGGLIPGSEGSASLEGDPYLANRGPDGWSTVPTGGKGSEATAIAPGGRSPDQEYSVWKANGRGPAVLGGGEGTIYLRYPDGHSELLGQGELADDPNARPLLISEHGEHIVFSSYFHLLEQSPPIGQGIYERSANGTAHLVSVLPDGSTGQDVKYWGASLDGRGIAFGAAQEGATTTYLRYGGRTYPVGTEPTPAEPAERVLTFAGIAEGGSRLFYLEGGNLFAFDAEGEETIEYAGGGEVTVVNVSADGSTAYLVSPDKLTGSPNPLGGTAAKGKQNLYRSEEGAISFVGAVSKGDIEGENLNIDVNGLGLWVVAAGGGITKQGGYAADPSRTTADGKVLLFQSNSDLTPYGSGGHRQIYRYDYAGEELTCVSCNPTGAAPIGDATLQDIAQSTEFDPRPNTPFDVVKNLSADGRRAFFQSQDPLSVRDHNGGVQDVYEWVAQGVGNCTEVGGCVYLISSGSSEQANYLYAASESGEDVFFSTVDRLRPIDGDATPSIYDARVGGGFPEPVAPECEAEGCRPTLSPAPLLPSPGSVASGKSGNVLRNCPKGKHRVKRHGKPRCVKTRRHRHRGGTNGHRHKAKSTGKSGRAGK